METKLKTIKKVKIDHDEHHDDHHDHGFIRKYIFSEDHKIIAKQFLITGIFRAVVGGLFSSLFRIQLGFPDLDLSFLSPIIGNWLTPQGKIDESNIRINDNIAINSGIYTFSFSDASTAQARYTFVYKLVNYEWF